MRYKFFQNQNHANKFFNIRITKLFILLVIGIIILIFPALWNRYPLVYSDTGTYIIASIIKYVPVDRPIGYSLFINFTSLRWSLWIPIITQAIITVILIHLLIVFTIKFKEKWIITLIVITFLMLTTGIDNFISQLMPDIWSGMMLIAIFIILIIEEKNLKTDMFLITVIVFSCLFHYSNLLLLTAIFLIILIITGFNLKKNKNFITRLKIVGITVIFSWILAPTINLIYNEGFKLARTKNIFFAAKLADAGILQEYLKENCNKKTYILCDKKDSIILSGTDFLWINQPFYNDECLKNGWITCWDESDPEFGILIKDILKEKKYFKKVFQLALKSTWLQLKDFEIGQLSSMKENTAPYYVIKTYYNKEFDNYTNAVQFKKDLFFRFSSKIQLITIILSVLIIIILMMYSKLINVSLNSFYLFLMISIAGLIINAGICGFLSTIVNRYQSRIIWLVPLAMIIGVFTFYESKRN